MADITFVYRPYSLTSDEPFGTAHGQRSHTDIILVEISQDGVTGIGEGSMPPYYEESQDDMIWFMGQLDPERLLNYDDIGSALAYVDQIASGYTASKAAIDIALHDLRSKQARLNLADFLDVKRDDQILSSITIGLSDLDRMIREVKELSDFPILKVKLGSGIDDIKIMQSIRNISDQRLWIDANQGWSSVEEALTITSALEEIGVELIEQPFKVGEWEKVAQLVDKSNIAIVADEDCQRLEDIDKLAPYYDAINIKLMKCTGVHEAMKMIHKARILNLKVMLGCMTESSIGISAAAHLAPLVDWADLDGNMLINNDPACGVKIEDGLLISGLKTDGHGAALKIKHLSK